MSIISKRQKIRQELQQQAVDLFAENPHIMLRWATGVGKTLATLKCIDTYPRGLTWVVVVKELFHKDTWKRELDKWGFPEDKISFITYHSLHKLDNSKDYGLIFDEGHALTPKRRDKLYMLKVQSSIMLSATLSSEKRFLYYCWKGYAEIEYTINQSILDGVTPEPVINILDIPMSLDEKVTYHDMTETIKKTRTAIRNRPKLAYELKMLLFERKRWMATTKFNKISKHLTKLHSSSTRTVIFVNNIEQCDEVGGAKAIHSQNKNRYKILESFNSEEINHIFAVNMLRESANLVGIELGILLQTDAEDRGFLQVAGRVFRSNRPVLYLCRLEGTADSKYISECVSTLNTYTREIKFENFTGFTNEIPQLL